MTTEEAAKIHTMSLTPGWKVLKLGLEAIINDHAVFLSGAENPTKNHDLLLSALARRNALREILEIVDDCSEKANRQL